MSAAIPQDHLAAIFYQKGGPVKVEKIPTTQPKDLKPGEALVNVKYSGVCHTDLHAMLGDWPLPNKLPLVGGHEGAGVIVAIGEHTDTELKVGDKVGIKWLADSCLKCDLCRQGFEPNCQKAQCSGFSVDGSFQEYAVSFTRHLTKIPDELSLADAAPILCAGVTVYRAIKESHAQPGQWIVVSGAGGGLGHLAIQYATAMGLRVIAVDTGAEKKELCEKLGAEKWIDFRETKNIIEAIKNTTPDRLGPHATLVASSAAAAYEEAMEYIRPRGFVVAIGLPPDATVKANVFWTVLQSKTLVGSYVGNRQDAVEALDFAAAGKVKTIYKILPLSKLGDIYDDMHHGRMAGRVVLDLSA